uniref:NADH-ubiquinone oxidoreductase chain 2 n=1 Tax=Cardiodactylus muiri TaxID=2184234 RepID=A0A343XAN1_9ORTH|nr:NADH dehydrogenase subunit 2 [Cardiodactylus muiri]AWI49112.1 NADH dehydrogenase subunit 2 [Cardiodactylus muiri]
MLIMNPSKISFMLMMMLGTLISIMSNSWPATWIGLEINLLSFIPLMYTKKNIFSSEASMKYFIIQALASSLMLIIIILSTMIPNLIYNNSLMQSMTAIPLMMKMGAAPFHMWFPTVMEGLSWMNCLILMTWQKIAPMTIMSYLNIQSWLIYMTSIMSVMIGSIGGLNQTSTRKIMAYSSINHMGWMILTMMMSEMLWQIYLTVYSIISLTLMIIFMNFSGNQMNQLMFKSKSPIMKAILLMNLLSLGGLPPFLGFLPKWLVIQLTIQQNSVAIILMMVLTTLITLFYYIQLGMTTFMMNSNQMKWNHQKKMIINHNIIMTLSMISLFSLPLYSILFLIL